ncbi:VOC family protein [Subtercola boreus]|uniref:Glyoxalase n=1 Tax=Subtercola boreus TaxID=120213 RepID=A0A3E0WAC8_9MICO|nr:VOC family protein [Subtercola boreus]RFA20844.1 glyoxalase [Subtercola boreus]RFA20958.1 glyoxalase [Subtercola boreus]RFA27152.1 glyoxalase [Subtercola boreus]
MATNNIFVNLPVSDLEASKAFYTALGYSINPQFSNENAASIVLSDSIYIMLLVKPFFSTFTEKELVDPKRYAQVLNALGVDSREEVDELIAKGVAAGGTEPAGTLQDHGFMYSRDLEDPDGHGWEIMWMDPAVAAGGPPSE